MRWKWRHRLLCCALALDCKPPLAPRHILRNLHGVHKGLGAAQRAAGCLSPLDSPGGTSPLACRPLLRPTRSPTMHLSRVQVLALALGLAAALAGAWHASGGAQLRHRRPGEVSANLSAAFAAPMRHSRRL